VSYSKHLQHRPVSSTNVFSLPGNATLAGATAAFMANLVLLGYVYVAWKDDEASQREAASGQKKTT
jgi:hypothetical protein